MTKAIESDRHWLGRPDGRALGEFDHKAVGLRAEGTERFHAEGNKNNVCGNTRLDGGALALPTVFPRFACLVIFTCFEHLKQRRRRSRRSSIGPSFSKPHQLPGSRPPAEQTSGIFCPIRSVALRRNFSSSVLRLLAGASAHPEPSRPFNPVTLTDGVQLPVGLGYIRSRLSLPDHFM